MKTQNQKNKIIKCRCTETEYQSILQLAQQKNQTVSDILRQALFNNTMDSFTMIQKELLKQGMYNLILASNIKPDTRNTLIKEIEKL